MNVRLASVCILLVAVLCTCGGGGGGGGPPPPPPNSPPAMTVPGGISGTNPSYLCTLATGSTVTRTFTATDPEGDPLLWQVGVPGAAATAAGLVFTTPVTGTTFTLELAVVTSPAAAPVTLLVEDPRGAAAAIDLLVVRTGAPSIAGVAPNSSFATLPQQVTLTGNGFELGGIVNTTASFDGFASPDVNVVSNSELTCSTPAAVAAGPTIVAVGHQFGNASLPDTEFTVHAFPPVLAATDQRLDAATVTSFQLANDGPTMHAVWQEGTSIVHRVSADGGTSWSSPATPVSGPEAASEPQVIALGDDVGVAWIGDGDSVWFARSDDGGATFQTPQRLDDVAAAVSPTRRPRLGQVGDRRYVAWLEGDALAGLQRVVATASPDRGVTWAFRQKISDAANQDNHEIHCSGAIAWVVMEDDRLGAPARGVYVVSTPNAGENWGLAQRLNTPGSAGALPRGCGAGSRAHVAWLQGDELLYASSIDSGQAWGNTVTTIQDNTTGDVTDAAIACDPQRVVFSYVIGGTLVWTARIPSFGAPVQRAQVDSLPTASAETAIHLANNYAYVAWREGDVLANTARVRVAVSGNGSATFGSNDTFGNGTAAQQAPQLVFDGARLVLGWLDSRDPTVGLFTNRVQ